MRRFVHTALKNVTVKCRYLHKCNLCQIYVGTYKKILLLSSSDNLCRLLQSEVESINLIIPLLTVAKLWNCHNKYNLITFDHSSDLFDLW